MEFSSGFVSARLIARRKRFFADAILEDGSAVTAHCPNPGSMLGNAEPNAKIYLHDFGEKYQEQGKKLRYRWDFVERTLENGNHFLVCIHTGLANKIFQEAFLQKKIPAFSNYSEIIPEFSVGESRLDFLLRNTSGFPDCGTSTSCFVEIKSVSMYSKGIAYFPDSITKRGQKHLLELMEIVRNGSRAVLLFLIQNSIANTFRPADFIDKDYGELLRTARKNGVEVMAYNLVISLKGMRLGSQCRLDF